MQTENVVVKYFVECIVGEGLRPSPMKTASEASRQTLKAVIDTTDREIDARVYTPLKRRITGVSTLWLRITSPMAASSNACKKCAAFSVKRSSNPYRLIATPTLCAKLDPLNRRCR